MRRSFFCLLAGFLLLTTGLAGRETSEAVLQEAARIAASLDDSVLASQVIMSGVDGKSGLDADMGRILADCPPGAIMLFKYNLDSPKDKARAFIGECRDLTASAVAAKTGGTAIPPLIAVDHEGGQVHRFGPGISRLPAAASWEDRAKREGNAAALAALEEAAYESGAEIRDLGVTLILGPVAEPLNDDNRLFLEDRGFSAEPGFTAGAAAAYIRGMERAGLGCVAKHFPGNSGVDPHRGVSVLSGSREELALAVQPFAALTGGAAPRVAGIMVSHALVPAWDTERIGSLSPALIGRWLRGELGFRGIVLADDFSMTAASSRINPEEAAVLSLAAGADMVMTWPSGLRKLRGAILAALERGNLSRGRLEEAAARIIAEKIRLGIFQPPPPPANSLPAG
ncbi:MAG: glycoside hydrolase family 3 protein [Treponema sp.]|jgi:beta-N-acetylhexosaminidase|nr:glycoside hydrolase family 3 protein [Treponema sp.]